MACLYVVATPIGNLEDVTLRALRVLGEADVIACEDTRHTRILLEKHSIAGKPLIACHARNEASSAQGIVKLLDQGRSVAYVSDAGTPGVSDPGSRVVQAVRLAGHTVVPVPGPSAMATLVSAAGMAGRGFWFEGFLSPKQGRRRSRLAELLARGEPFIVYESPFRMEKTLSLLQELSPGRRITVGREMTKIHEEFPTGTAGELLARFASVYRGEFALLVHGAAQESGEMENPEDSEEPEEQEKS